MWPLRSSGGGGGVRPCWPGKKKANFFCFCGFPYKKTPLNQRLDDQNGFGYFELINWLVTSASRTLVFH